MSGLVHRVLLLAAVLPLAVAGCGYHLAHAPVDPLGPFSVRAGGPLVPDVTVLAAAEEGARAELARAGALSGADAPTVIEVDVLRVDEGAEGIVAAAGAPQARGARITVLGRARARRAGTGEVLRDTGDVRVAESVGLSGGAARGVLVGAASARRSARRLGEVLVRRLLGVPDPGDP